MSAVACEPVPVLPRAAELRETVLAVEAGLKLLKGLAVAVERAERRVVRAADLEPDEPAPRPAVASE